VICFLDFNLDLEKRFNHYCHQMESKFQRVDISNGSVEWGTSSATLVSVDCAIFGFEHGLLKILLKHPQEPSGSGQWILPGDFLHATEDLDQACHRIVRNLTGLEHSFVEQVRTFGKKDNHPAGRIISTVHFSLVDLRNTGLRAPDEGLAWHPVSGLRLLTDDHKTLLEVCLQALQEKIQQVPIVFNLLPDKFSLRELQQVFEEILGTAFDRRNFRKKLFATGLMRDEDEMEKQVRHRPGKLYSFDRPAYAQQKKYFLPGLFF
jgi:8-oxo-dGTP diphosphatase